MWAFEEIPLAILDSPLRLWIVTEETPELPRERLTATLSARFSRKAYW
jgi:hypothetical protein